MNGIWTIFRDDLHRIRHNVMTALMFFSLAVIPMIFSSFNVLASWDPFGNTANLQIAVASTDEGYDTDLVQMQVNLGDQVLSQLARNDQIDWVITERDDAIEGTRSGEYYAAIVLPPTFSTDLLTFYTAGAEPAELDLYTNEKLNALSPIVATQGAEGVTTQINTAFTEVVANVGLGLVDSFSEYLGSSDTQAALERVQSRVSDASTRLASGADTARSFSGVIDSSITLVEGAGNIVDAAGASVAGTPDATGTGELDSTLAGTATSLSAGLRGTADSYGAVASRIDALFASADATSESAAETYRTLGTRVGQQTESLRALRDNVAAVPGTEGALVVLDTAVARSQNLQDNLLASADDIAAGRGTSQESRQSSREAVDLARTAVSDAAAAYEQDLQPQLEGLGASLDTLRDDVAVVRDDLDRAGTLLDESPGSLTDSLVRARDITASLATRLDEDARRFDDLNRELTTAGETGDFTRVAEMIGNDPEALATHLSSPVAVDRQEIFPVASFGSGMAPLYLTLSLWVGALLASVLIRTESGATGFSRVQSYFGRFGIFSLLGFVQSTLAALSLIVFVQVQPAHSVLLLLTAWVVSQVFMLILYTLIRTFGSVGKALAVLLLVIQVSGAGGSYPLPLLPQWFQNVSPWLPATYSIDAMRAAIAGIYQGDLFRELGIVLVFVLPTLLIGLLLGPLLESYNRKTTEAIESTKVMI